MPLVHVILVADSRAKNFHRFKKPLSSVPYKTHYIVQPGGTIQSLSARTIQYLKSNKIPHRSQVIVKIALGINNIVFKNKSVKPYTLTHQGTKETLDGLLQFRDKVYKIKSDAVVSFITIPPIHFGKNLEVRGLEQHTEALIQHQQAHVSDVLDLNRLLIDINRHQKHIPIVPHCACWHTDIVRESKKKKRNGEFRIRRTVIKNLLIDGVHGTSMVQHLWFDKWHQSARIDVRNILLHQKCVTAAH